MRKKRCLRNVWFKMKSSFVQVIDTLQRLPFFFLSIGAITLDAAFCVKVHFHSFALPSSCLMIEVTLLFGSFTVDVCLRFKIVSF